MIRVVLLIDPRADERRPEDPLLNVQSWDWHSLLVEPEWQDQGAAVIVEVESVEWVNR